MKTNDLDNNHAIVLREHHEELADKGISINTGEHIGFLAAQDELADVWGDEGE